MKILHITPSYLPAYSYGGPILSVHSLNKWLVKRGADITVFTTNIDNKGTTNVPLYQKVLIDGVKVWYFPISFRKWKYSFKLHKELAKKAMDFDLIHITSVFLSASTLGAYYSKKFNKPYIISPRGSLMKEPLEMRSSLIKKIYIALIEKRNLLGASAIHFTAEKEKEEYSEAGLDFKSFFVMPNALDSSDLDKYKKTFFRKKFNIPQKKKVILSLGRISWKKGFDTLIPAFAQVLKKEPDSLLVIAGESDQNYKKEVEKIIKENNIFGNVLFTGMLLGEDKAGAFKESDVFVLPTYSENFGMSVIEAMHCKLPVVVSEGVGIGEDIIENNAGIVVKKEESDFSEAIWEVLKNKQFSRKIGLNGYGFVKNKFAPDVLTKEIFYQYEKLIELYSVL